MKFRHLLDEALGVSAAEISLLAVLMLRGPQTPGELRQRVERLHPFATAGDLAATLDGLIGRELVARLPRRPGQKEERYGQLLGDEVGEEDAPADASASEERPDRFGALEERVTRIEEQLHELLDRLGG